MKARGILLVISGFAGTGKGTLVSALLEKYDNYALSVSATTRSPRPGEVDGVHYFFKTKEEFQEMIRAEELIEYAQYVENFYGTPRSFVERQLKKKSVLLEIDVVGGLNAKRLMPACTVLIMVTPPSMQELERRLAGRGSEGEDALRDRIQRVRYELDQAPLYDYVVVNDDLQRAKREIQDIIRKEKEKKK